MIEVQADLWSYPAEWVVVTTNLTVDSTGLAVMGAGCAAEAALRFPRVRQALGRRISQGDRVCSLLCWQDTAPTLSAKDPSRLSRRLIALPTKFDWQKPSPPSLVCASLIQLRRFWLEHGSGCRIVMPRPGCGHGGQDWAKVKSTVRAVFPEPQITVVDAPTGIMRRGISGGQSGADLAGLDAARICGRATGGWMPKGYRTEEGVRPEYRHLYGLRESDAEDYSTRTQANVEGSAGTALFGDMSSSGSALTIRLCEAAGKPFILNPSSKELIAWAREQSVDDLNVAGNRESVNPGIYQRTLITLVGAYRLAQEPETKQQEIDLEADY